MPQSKVIFLPQIRPQFKKIKVYTMKLNFSKIQSKFCQSADGPVKVNQKIAVFRFKFGNLGNQI